MNLHVTNDTYGLYTLEIAERIKNSEYEKTNIIVNLSASAATRVDSVAYIPYSKISFTEYIGKLKQVDKVIFHP